MKAAVCYEFGKPLVVEEVDIDPPDKGEVKVRVGAAAICHSDIHDIKGEHGTAELPAVGGHEIAGYVAEVGEGVTSLKSGDPVIVSVVTSGCGKCYYCTMGFPKMCEKAGGPARLRHFAGLSEPGRYINKRGQRLTQLSGKIAGFVEYTTVPVENVVKISDEMPIDRAALLACGVISGFGAVVHHAQVKPFSSVVVVGTGGVGLNVIQGAVFVGAYPIIAVDILDSKLETARAFGATHTINSRKEKDPVEAAFRLTLGRGADYVFIAVAGIDILRQGFEMSGRCGTTVILGHGWKEYLSAFEPTDFIDQDRTITGCAMGGNRLNIQVEIPRLVELYRIGRLKLDELITSRYPLEGINEAMASVERGEALRNVIMF